MTKFNKGDILVALEDSGGIVHELSKEFIKGSLYICESHHDGRVRVVEDNFGRPNGWSEQFFELATESKEEMTFYEEEYVDESENRNFKYGDIVLFFREGEIASGRIIDQPIIPNHFYDRTWMVEVNDENSESDPLNTLLEIPEEFLSMLHSSDEPEDNEYKTSGGAYFTLFPDDKEESYHLEVDPRWHFTAADLIELADELYDVAEFLQDNEADEIAEFLRYNENDEIAEFAEKAWKHYTEEFNRLVLKTANIGSCDVCGCKHKSEKEYNCKDKSTNDKG